MALRNGVGSQNARAKALVEAANQEILNLRRKLAADERAARGSALSIEKARAFDDRKRELDRAEKELASYAPVLGGEHCPSCFAFKRKTAQLSFSFHPGKVGAFDPEIEFVTATCPCGFRTRIPPQQQDSA